MIARLLPSLLLGAVISLALFWLMSAMTMNKRKELLQTSPIKMIEFVRLKRKIAPKTKERRRLPDKPQPIKHPPPPAMQAMQTRAPVKTDIPSINMPGLDIPLRLDQFSGSAVAGISVDAEAGPAVSADVIPLVRIAPKYPMRAQMRRIEGWVKVLFIITETGAVRGVEVVKSQPAGVFDRAAVDAIEKWKFKPKLLAGAAVEQRAAQVLEFKLSK